MRIFRRKHSIWQVCFRRNALNIRSGTLLCLFIVSMLSLFSALTWPLSQKGNAVEKRGAPVRGPFVLITNTAKPEKTINATRYEPTDDKSKKRPRAISAGVVYITKHDGDELYFQENSFSAISKGKKKSEQGKIKKTGDSTKPGVKNVSKASTFLHKNKSSNILQGNPTSVKYTKHSPEKYKPGNNYTLSEENFNSRTKKEVPISNLSKGNQLTKIKNGITIARKKNDKLASRTIRFYAKPPWMSDRDIQILRLLTEGHVERRISLSQNRSADYLLFVENATHVLNYIDVSTTQVAQRIRSFLDAIAVSSRDRNKILAFHIDRVIGLNRVVPTATRLFTNISGSNIEGADALMWFPADLPPKQVDDDSLEATRFVKKKYWRFSDRQRWAFNDSCASSDEDTRGRLAVFAFLLQISSANLQECFKYPANHSHAPKHLDVSGHVTCRNTFWGSDMRVAGQTWCLPPSKISLQPTQQLDYSMIELVSKLPEELVQMIQSTRLRQRLLQSLFIDKLFWDTVGGRKAIDELLELFDKRGKSLVKWLRAKNYIGS